MVEYKLPKLGVASSNLVARSTKGRLFVIRLEALEAGSILFKTTGNSAGLQNWKAVKLPENARGMEYLKD